MGPLTLVKNITHRIILRRQVLIKTRNTSTTRIIMQSRSSDSDSLYLVCVFSATAPGPTPVPAPGPGPARDPAASGPHPSHPARRLIQLRPALPLFHPGQLLPRTGPGGEGGQGPGGGREGAPRRGRGQVRLAQTQQEEGSGRR